MAPQATEFGAKVGLLGGLTICSAMLPLRRMLAANPVVAHVGRQLAPPDPRETHTVAALALITIAGLALFGATVARLGSIATEPNTLDARDLATLVDPTEVLPPVDPSTLPLVEVDPEVPLFDADMTGATAQQLAAQFA
jgi:hypothetical protein